MDTPLAPLARGGSLDDDGSLGELGRVWSARHRLELAFQDDVILARVGRRVGFLGRLQRKIGRLEMETR